MLFYHHDCPDCRRAIRQCEQMARDLAGNEDFLRIALIEVPPYGPAPHRDSAACVSGRLVNTKEWFITTPAVVLLTNMRVETAWEETLPDLETIVSQLARSRETQRSGDLQGKVSPAQTSCRERR